MAYIENISNLREQEIEQTEASIEIFKEQIELGKALERLNSNKDFELVVRKGIIEAEGDRVFSALTSVPMLKNDTLDKLEEKLSMIRYLKEMIGCDGYDGLLAIRAGNAAESLEDSEKYINYVRSNQFELDIIADQEEEELEDE